jgi:hypothetical protein
MPEYIYIQVYIYISLFFFFRKLSSRTGISNGTYMQYTYVKVLFCLVFPDCRKSIASCEDFQDSLAGPTDDSSLKLWQSEWFWC